jgi:GNAT superfamily N-acetyltransferase
MKVSIRPATTADLETIIEIQTKSLSNLPARFRKYDRYQVDSLIVGQAAWRRIDLSHETTLIAADDRDRLIGFISFCLPQISGLFVDPEFMNNGVGSMLLGELEQIAIEQRIKKLVVLSSIESVEFYQKNGYETKQNTGFLSENSVWIPCQLLEKELIPATPIERFLATQTVKIALSGVLLTIVATIAHKADKRQIGCPAPNCPEIIAPSQK